MLARASPRMPWLTVRKLSCDPPYTLQDTSTEKTSSRTSPNSTTPSNRRRNSCLARRTPPSPLTQMRQRGSTLPPVRAKTQPPMLAPSPVETNETTDTESSVSTSGHGCAACGRRRGVKQWSVLQPCGVSCLTGLRQAQLTLRH